MLTRINCIYNDDGGWCKNKKIRRSLFGIGARCCAIYPYDGGKECKYQESYKPPRKKNLNEKKTAYNDYHNLELKSNKVVDWRKDIEKRLTKLEKIVESDFRLKEEYRE